MGQRPTIPQDLKSLVEQVGPRVTSEDVEVFGKFRRIHDQSKWIRAAVKAWTEQQTQDRAMREKCAKYLFGGMAAQALIINVVYVLMGLQLLSYQEWTAKTFIMGVFGETVALMLLVVKYLFRTTGDKVFDIIDEAKKGATSHGD